MQARAEHVAVEEAGHRVEVGLVQIHIAAGAAAEGAGGLSPIALRSSGRIRSRCVVTDCQRSRKR